MVNLLAEVLVEGKTKIFVGGIQDGRELKSRKITVVINSIKTEDQILVGRLLQDAIHARIEFIYPAITCSRRNQWQSEIKCTLGWEDDEELVRIVRRLQEEIECIN